MVRLFSLFLILIKLQSAKIKDSESSVREKPFIKEIMVHYGLLVTHNNKLLEALPMQKKGVHLYSKDEKSVNALVKKFLASRPRS